MNDSYRHFKLLLIFGIATLIGNCAFGWGSDGHRIINQSFTTHYPINQMYFTKFTSYYAAHASDADKRKGAGNPDEAPRHFIDIDWYPEFATSWFPHDLDSLVAEYDSSVVYTNGILPWAIKADYDSLVTFLREGDTVNSNRVIADLGHYIGDACQPLHCTQNYNRNGIHSPYETTMIQDNLSSITIIPDSAHYIEDVLDFAFKTIYKSNSKVQQIFNADDQAGGSNARKNSSTAYYQTLWSLLDTMTIGQLQTASVSLASLVYSAYQDAGLLTRAHVTTPSYFNISGLYPNPFNPTAHFNVDMPSNTGMATAHVSIFAIDGTELKSYNVRLSGGMNVLALDLSRMSSGMYLARVEIAGSIFHQTKTLKALLIK